MSAAFSADAIRAALPPALQAELAQVRIAEETASTQADALTTGAPVRGVSLFLAEHQTQGQGRHGRAWLSAPAEASLAFSLLRRFDAPVHAMAGLSLVTGIAVAEALRLPAVKLKWPNDLVAEGRKLGGILVNLRTLPGSACEAVVGIGLNLRLPDASDIDQPWTDLARLGAPARSRSEWLGALLASLLPAFAQFEREGMAAFQQRWREFDALAGQAVRVHEGTRVHEGEFAGITDSGALRLRAGEGGGERVFASGEVSLRPA